MTKNLAPPPLSDQEITNLIRRELGFDVIAQTTLRSGAWSSAIAVTTADHELVLRFSDTADDFHCDAIAAQFSGPDLPIPKVHRIGQVESRHWCISDRMPGIHLDDLDAKQMSQTLPSIVRMLIAMREVDTSATNGYGGWDQNGNGVFPSFADQLLDVGNDVVDARGGGWRPVLDQHGFEKDIFDLGLTRLADLSEYLPADRHLIHEDTLNYNVVVRNNRISGIFDWGTAMWGDAVYDLAWFRFWNPWYPQWSELNIPDYLEREVGIIGNRQEERMQCCLIHIGLMHIRYNAFIGNLVAMNDVAKATEKLL